MLLQHNGEPLLIGISRKEVMEKLFSNVRCFPHYMESSWFFPGYLMVFHHSHPKSVNRYQGKNCTAWRALFPVVESVINNQGTMAVEKSHSIWYHQGALNQEIQRYLWTIKDRLIKQYEVCNE